jgi:hypothetical protein
MSHLSHMLSPSRAAKVAGVGKATIQRAIKAGKLSATRQENGSFLIDPAELARVYESVRSEPMSQSEPRNEPSEPAGARELIALLERQIADIRSDRDAWRDQAQRLALAPPPAPLTKPSLFTRVFGRKVA